MMCLIKRPVEDGSHFKKDDFSLKDEPRKGCSKEHNSEELQAVIDENPTSTTRELCKEFNMRHVTMYCKMIRPKLLAQFSSFTVSSTRIWEYCQHSLLSNSRLNTRSF
ncbi:hypothetical protein FHG87_003780 [Trinorchestia longiramus]|nr:hypothetical protein FHG87_003780 [Trinorchestia longiramus]